MGREVRRVPPNWEHPKNEKDDDYLPMYDCDFDTAITQWYEDYLLWKEGKHPDQIKHPSRTCFPFWEWDGSPPDPELHRPAWSEDPTWYQMYETVSEGTPVSPPFATKEELVNYLVEHGDFWDQNRGDGGWDRESAKTFVDEGWRPSGWIIRGVTDIMTPRDGTPFEVKDE